MSKPTEKPKLTGVLSEETVRQDGYSEDAEENPYWLAEEPDPHPNPELGCIRRNLCCRSNPGWFAPGEVEKAAELLDMSPDAFFKKYLVIDFTELDGQRVEVFAPVKLGRDGEPLIPAGTRTKRIYQMLRSPCVFFDGSGCKIYGARPIECRSYVCTNEPEDNLSHTEIAKMWLEGEGADE